MRRPTAPTVGRFILRFLLVWLFIGIAACGSSRGFPPGGPSSSRTINRAQIRSVPERSAYDLILFLRPRWLDARIMATPRDPNPIYAHVYLDDFTWGPLESLNDIPSQAIEQIDFLSALDATTRYGGGYMGGIIRIYTRIGR